MGMAEGNRSHTRYPFAVPDKKMGRLQARSIIDWTAGAAKVIKQIATRKRRQRDRLECES